MTRFTAPWRNHGVPWYRRNWEASYLGKDGQDHHVLAYSRDGASVKLMRGIKRENRRGKQTP